MGRIQSILSIGSKGMIVDVECQLSNGLPAIVIVGLGNKAIDEAKERIRSAFASCGLELPRKRVTVNLAPADVPKESTGLDAAIAATILAASSQTSRIFTETQAIIGEVGLDGSVRAVRGIIGKLITGKKLGIQTFLIPEGNLRQALLVPDIIVIPIKTIRDLCDQKPTTHSNATESLPSPRVVEHTLAAVTGQVQAKRALEIAAAGGHNILLSGPPGTGKSMLAKALPSLLPPLSHQEMLEVTHLHSLASHNYEELVTERPFRAPHHSSSNVSIIGGGSNARPGEVTLSHHGVLFLDELPEFNRLTLEALRQPLEDTFVTVARAKQTVEYPANFILVATANPCPCGFYGTTKSCRCTPGQILRYQQKISGPILDRIDLHISVDSVEHEHLLVVKPDEDRSDDHARERIKKARQIQKKRYPLEEKVNAGMSNMEIKQYGRLDPDAASLLNTAAAKLDISARSYMRLVKVARTIADLEGSEGILTAHISEALQYRFSRPPV